MIVTSLTALIYVPHGAIAQPETKTLTTDDAKPKLNLTQGEDKTANLTPLKDNIVVYKATIDPNSPKSQTLIDIVDGRSVIFRHNTSTYNIWTKFEKTWEHDITSSRACKKPTSTTTSSTPDTDCIIGRKNIVKLPLDSSPFDFAYFIEWSEGGTIHSGIATLDKNFKPIDKRSLR